jgi:hypothetical protein
MHSQKVLKKYMKHHTRELVLRNIAGTTTFVLLTEEALGERYN